MEPDLVNTSVGNRNNQLLFQKLYSPSAPGIT